MRVVMLSRRLLSIISLFVFLLATAHFSHAQSGIVIDTVYVAVTGDNVFGTGTKNNPWRSLSSAMQRITADSLNRKIIKLGPGVFSVATTGEFFPIPFKSFVAVLGSGKLQTKLDAVKAARLFSANNLRHAKILELALENGRAKGATADLKQGGALRVKKFFQLEIRNCILRGNQADSSGGALFVSSGAGFTLQDCLLEKNAASEGGVVYHDSSQTTTIIGNTAQFNTAKNAGGAFFFNNASPLLQKNRVRWNTANEIARRGGGGLMLVNSKAVIGGAFDQGNDIHDNKNGGRGSEIYVEDARSFVDARFNFFGAEPTSAFAYPASLLNVNNYRTVAVPVPFGAKDFYVAPNGSDENNGTLAQPWRTINFGLSQIFARELDTLRLHLQPGVYSPIATGEQFPIRLETQVSLLGSGAETTIIDGTGSTNNAELLRIFNAENLRVADLTLRKAKNGALAARHADRLTLDHLIFEDNAGARGAGALLAECSHPIIQQNIFRRNKSAQNGGGLLLMHDDAQVTGNAFIGNSAKNGGAVYCDSSSSTRIESNEIVNNQAETGGGIFIAQSAPKIILNRILQNSATIAGGGIALDGAAVPDLGARKSQSNDIYDNVAPGNGTQVLRTSPGITIDARFNYWGEVPGDKLIAPLAQFSTDQFRHVALQIPAEAVEIFVSPSGDDRAPGDAPGAPLRTIGGALKLVFGAANRPMRLTLLPGKYSKENNGESFPVQLENFITLAGSAPGLSEIDAANVTRIFEGRRVQNFAVETLALRRGNTTQKGGVAYLDSVYFSRWNNCEFLDNNAAFGGALSFEGGRGNAVSNSRFRNNRATKRGGAIVIENDSLLLELCDFRENEAELSGGAIHNGTAAIFTLQNSRLQQNRAAKGGAVAVVSGLARVFKNIIIDNTASDTTGGGGIHVAAAGNAVIGGSANEANDLYGNQCPISGANLAGPSRAKPIEARYNYFGAAPTGALVSLASAFEVSNARRKSIVIPETQTTLYLAPSGNDATSLILPHAPLRTIGQALRMFYGTPITLSLARGNYASATNGERLPIQLKSFTRLAGTHRDSVFINGLNASGLLEIAEAESIEVRNLTLVNGKTSGNGAGLRIHNAQAVTLSNVHFNKNTTAGFGGGLAAENVKSLSITQCLFSENNGNGAGAFIRDAEGVLFGSTLQGNKSPARGSALYLENAALQLTTNRIMQNTVEAGETGGAIYCRGTVVPVIGGEPGRGNDIYNNIGGAMGKQLSRTGNAPIINARYNYFATAAPGEETASPLAGFDLSFARTQPLEKNNAPVVQSVTPLTNQTLILSKEDTVNFAVIVVDPDNDPLTYVWHVNDFPLSFGTSYSFFSVFYREGLHTVRLLVSDGTNTLELNWNLQIGATSVAAKGENLPAHFKLERPYPNPLRLGAEGSTIALHLPRASAVRLFVYDLLGKQVRTLISSNKSAGVHRLAWNGRNDAGQMLPAGVYILKMTAGEFQATAKIILLQ